MIDGPYEYQRFDVPPEKFDTPEPAADDLQSGSTVVRQCEKCHEWRHVTWFRGPGDRYCRTCMDDDQGWLDSLAISVKREQAAERERAQLKGAMHAILSGARPKGISPRQWRVLHARALGVTHKALGDQMRVPANRVAKIEMDAIAKLTVLAKARVEATN